MKHFLLATIGCCLVFLVQAQSFDTARLWADLRTHPAEDSGRVNRLLRLGSRIGDRTGDSLVNASLAISRRIGYPRGEVFSLLYLCYDKPKTIRLQMISEAVDLSAKTSDKALQLSALDALLQALPGTPRESEMLGAAQKELAIALSTSNADKIASAEDMVANCYGTAGNMPMAMEWLFKALSAAEKNNRPDLLMQIKKDIGKTYSSYGDNRNALEWLQASLAISRGQLSGSNQEDVLNDIGIAYNDLKRFPEALKTFQDALSHAEDPYEKVMYTVNIGTIYEALGNQDSSFAYAYRALAMSRPMNFIDMETRACELLAEIHQHRDDQDSALYYALKTKALTNQTGAAAYIYGSSEVLWKAYAAKKDYANALIYYKRFIAYRDSLGSTQVANKANLAQYNYDLGKKQTQIDLLNKDKQLQAEQTRRRRWLLAGAAIGLLLVLGILAILYRYNRQRRKAYALLQSQKQEIQEQRDQTANALRELRQTQQQLVQSEKMASLGELTAGIAHEIQNPLNFVNNFAEVSIELLGELGEGPLLHLPPDPKEQSDGLIADITQNLEKIGFHGHRADAIVKSMLYHSRKSGQKELTDLNALALECLNLSYHGFRAKDQSFNAILQTDCDPATGFVGLIPQDISRVLLNLFTNSFYSVAQKSRAAGPDYQPTILLSTRRDGDNACVTVRDNGGGIPSTMLGKIYQPFFTTKPTGEGIGLGLSLSYDIITKSHDGTIAVETVEGEFAAFTICLPGKQHL